MAADPIHPWDAEVVPEEEMTMSEDRKRVDGEEAERRELRGSSTSTRWNDSDGSDIDIDIAIAIDNDIDNLEPLPSPLLARVSPHVNPQVGCPFHNDDDSDLHFSAPAVDPDFSSSSSSTLFSGTSSTSGTLPYKAAFSAPESAEEDDEWTVVRMSMAEMIGPMGDPWVDVMDQTALPHGCHLHA